LPGSNTKVCCVSWVFCVLQLVAALIDLTL